jgi:hypothetical protein
MPSPPTESRFAIRIKGSFATQSGAKQTSDQPADTSGFDPGCVKTFSFRKNCTQPGTIRVDTTV